MCKGHGTAPAIVLLFLGLIGMVLGWFWDDSKITFPSFTVISFSIGVLIGGALACRKRAGDTSRS